MGQHELISTLQSLHSQLSSSNDVDDQTRELLKTITSDIEKLLEEKQASATTAESDASVGTSLREMLIEFEVRHPHLGGLLQRITDGLSSIGI